MPTCTHLDQDQRIHPAGPSRPTAARTVPARRWRAGLHLRICLTCGHVGCCDDSPNRHASKHAREVSHPLIRFARAGRGLELLLHR